MFSFHLFPDYIVLQAVDAALNEDKLSKALILSLRLNEDSLIKKCIFKVSPIDIPAVVSSIPYRYLQRLIEALADLLESCPHVEFILQWCQVTSIDFRFCSVQMLYTSYSGIVFISGPH